MPDGTVDTTGPDLTSTDGDTETHSRAHTPSDGNNDDNDGDDLGAFRRNLDIHRAIDPCLANINPCLTPAPTSRPQTAPGSEDESISNTSAISRRHRRNSSSDNEELENGPMRKKVLAEATSASNELNLKTGSRARLTRFATVGYEFYAGLRSQLIQQQGILLSIRDNLCAKAEKWDVPATLKANGVANLSYSNQSNTRQYSNAVMFASNAYGYMSKDRVIGTMRRCAVPEIPDSCDKGRMDIFGADVATTCTGVRNAMKTKITATFWTTVVEIDGYGTRKEIRVAPKSKYIDIASLVLSIMGGTSLKITLHHYIRFAFLRWFIYKHPELSNTELWPGVDSKLRELRTFFSKEDLSAWFQARHQADLKSYGQARADLAVTDMADLEEWQMITDIEAERLPTVPAAPAAPATFTTTAL
ncbi:hypothetical protein DFH11DRAFT_1545898 [Phellopilus nigrolimitatus]|nr:hypothetical protein DFH11DRAFT_1545898 [Phellopilus nigrolimitatus]